MTLSDLKAALRSGRHPEELGGKSIGFMGNVKAYRIGQFVVKKTGGILYSKEDYSPYRNKIRFAPTIEVTGWLIQLYYNPLPTPHLWERVGNDIHGYNVGTDRRGRYVAFDW